MTDEQRTAKALLETPDVFKYLSENEIRVCKGTLADPWFLIPSIGPPLDEDDEQMMNATKRDAATLKNLENTFPREIAAWKNTNP